PPPSHAAPDGYNNSARTARYSRWPDTTPKSSTSQDEPSYPVSTTGTSTRPGSARCGPTLSSVATPTVHPTTTHHYATRASSGRQFCVRVTCCPHWESPVTPSRASVPVKTTDGPGPSAPPYWTNIDHSPKRANC